jgi:hypothetical protein
LELLLMSLSQLLSLGLVALEEELVLEILLLLQL